MRLAKEYGIEPVNMTKAANAGLEYLAKRQVLRTV
jgi:hypothetical protein